MKNLNSYLMMSVVVATTFFSCNQSDEITPDTPDKQIIQEDELIERNILNLSSADASKLAKRFAKNEYGGESRTASTISIKDIQTITSETGEALMYVVNYEDNKGFTVISATKNYTPVLAYSDEGYLNVNDASFTDNIFMDEYKAHIESVVNEENDSLRLRYAIDWSLYEKSPAVLESRTYSDTEIQQKLAEARTYYSNQGYEIHPLENATSLIPAAGGQTAEQRANGFINDICQHTPSEYDCMDVTLLLVKRSTNQYGEYINTSWSQGSPYCADAQNGRAGCVTIAVTQLMKHFEWPSYFGWSNIRTTWTGDIDDLTIQEKYFMNSVREKMNPDYQERITLIKPSDMMTALDYYNYNVTETNYNRNIAANYIKSGIPFIMFGYDNGDGHSWICDGYKVYSVQYAAYMINRDLDDYAFFSGMTDFMNEYFHMNLGTEPEFNAWYYQDSTNFGDYDFSENRKMYKITKKQ